jgi:hypothetical protein
VVWGTLASTLMNRPDVDLSVYLRRFARVMPLPLLLVLACTGAPSASSPVAGASVPGAQQCGPYNIRLSAGTQSTNEHNLVTLIVIDSGRGGCTLLQPTQLSVVAPGVEHTLKVGELPRAIDKRLVLGPRHYGSVGVAWGNWCGARNGVSVRVRFGATRTPWTAVVDQQNVPICGSSKVATGISLNAWGYEPRLASGVYAGVPSFPNGVASQTSISPR